MAATILHLHGGGNRLRSPAITFEGLWVLPARIGGRVGTALLEAACAEVAGRGARTLRIASDPEAEGFYLRRGARRIGEWRRDRRGGGYRCWCSISPSSRSGIQTTLTVEECEQAARPP